MRDANRPGRYDATRSADRAAIEATALTLLGAMREATFYVALAEDHERARREAGEVMNRLIHALNVATD